MNEIQIIVNFADEPDKPVTLKGKEGDSILDIVHDNNIELQHNCGGVCGCSTCHIYVDKGIESLPEISDDEEDRIDLAEDPKLTSRLACQCEIEKQTQNLEITIPSQDFLGH